MRVALGVFLVFHGMVHAMYVGHALRWFELKPGMPWPATSWALASHLSDGALRTLAAVSIGVASLALMVGGLGVTFGWGWANWVAIGAAALVSVPHILLWSGQWSDFADHGGIGIVINAAAIAAILASK